MTRDELRDAVLRQLQTAIKAGADAGHRQLHAAIATQGQTLAEIIVSHADAYAEAERLRTLLANPGEAATP